MTLQENYNNSVFELQSFLRELHFAGYPIDLIIPDGIYDEPTRKAVSQFQSYEGLNVTGIVDRATWDSLYGAYLSALFERSRPSPLYPFPEQEGYVLSMGEVSDIVLIVQIMLNSLSAHYDDVYAPPTGVYDSATRAAIENFQSHNNIPTTGLIDKTTWNRLAEVYNKYNNIVT
ncbi:MAG: peptidoglycan-binding protein [Ruminococcaceae bacterium]|nr:peptidoglycan-binding protein [Oscillospiraceae bacterium]